MDYLPRNTVCLAMQVTPEVKLYLCVVGGGQAVGGLGDVEPDTRRSGMALQTQSTLPIVLFLQIKADHPLPL